MFNSPLYNPAVNPYINAGYNTNLYQQQPKQEVIKVNGENGARVHDEAAKIIENYRETVGEPPAEMLAVYNYEHDKQIDRATKIKQMIAEYRNE